MGAALEQLPDELRQARWLLREREEFLADRAREADAFMEEVRVQAERMVSRTEIVRQANQVAQRILDDANEEARRMRHEAEDYCDQKLAGMEIVLERIMRTVQSGREKLQATAPSASEAPERPDGEPAEGGEDGFFDQDLSWPTRSEREAHRARAIPSSSMWPGSAGSPATRWHEVRAGPVDPDQLIVAGSPADSTIPEGAEAELRRDLQSFDGGVMATGTVTAPWQGVCRRCARPVGGELVIGVRERFCEPGAATATPTTRRRTPSSTTARPAADGPRRRRPRAAPRPPLPGGLRGACARVRGGPQHRGLWLCGTEGPQVG